MSLLNLQQQLDEHQQLLVAYSGGLDSTVLLHQLVCLRQQLPGIHLRAIHIHHGLNAHADSWVNHCQQQCAEWQVLFKVVHVRLDTRGKGVEAAARDARYQAFLENLQPGEVLLTAQHQNDQCETLLLALKRGSGPAGLSGMSASGKLGRYLHLRPLLDFSRSQLEKWAAEHHLRWIEDDSNQNQRYDRNFIRQAVMPLLNSRWPHFSQSVARSAALCAGQEQLLDELLSESLNALIDDRGSLAIGPMMKMSEARRSALIRRWIASQQGLMPSRDALLRIWHEIACSREDAEPRLRLGGNEIRRYRDRLYWLELCHSCHDVEIEWPPQQKSLALSVSGGLLVRTTYSARGTKEDKSSQSVIVRPPLMQERVTIRFQAHGKFHIVGRAGGRSLKKILQESAIPPWQRGRIPMIFYNDCLIAAVGVFVTREGDPGTEPGWQIRWQHDLA